MDQDRQLFGDRETVLDREFDGAAIPSLRMRHAPAEGAVLERGVDRRAHFSSIHADRGSGRPVGRPIVEGTAGREGIAVRREEIVELAIERPDP